MRFCIKSRKGKQAKAKKKRQHNKLMKVSMKEEAER